MHAAFKYGIAAALLGASALTLPAFAQAPAAARSPDQIAASVPTDVPEVHTGGGWQDGGAQGVYRAVVVLVPVENTARVYLQWLAVKPDNAAPAVLRSVPIKEVTDRKLPNAFVTLEAEKEGEATFIIASFDPVTNKDVVFAFKASKPGVYVETKVPEHGAGSGTAAPPAK